MALLPDRESLDRAVSAIYDAGLEPARLPAAIAAVADATGAAGGMLGVVDVHDGHSVALATVGIDPQLMALFEQRFVLNPWTEAVRLHARADMAVSSEQQVDAHALRATEFHDAILAPQGLVGASFYLLRREGRQTAGLAMMHRVPGRSAEPAVLDRMNRLVAHLGRALELMHRLDTLRQRLDTCEAALQQHRCALFVLDADARIRWTNARAELLLAEADGVYSIGHRLSARHNGDGAALAAAIAAAGGGAGTSAAAGARSLALRRGAARLPLLAFAVPGSASRRIGDLPQQPGEVLLFVADPGWQHHVAADLLREAFGLTEREVRIALATLRRGSLPAAAVELGIAPSTARSHLQHVFDKTGARNQVALARLLDACGVLPPGAVGG
jgi:DNA-binding CsgD family transcriptional regulator